MDNQSTIDSFISEIEELKKYKQLYEHQLKDKQMMSDELYKLMLREYNNTPYQNRVEQFANKTCSACRYEDYCDLKIPDNIGEPIKSDKAWIPATKSCGKFAWA